MIVDRLMFLFIRLSSFSNNLALGVGITVMGFRQGMDLSFVGEEDQEDQSLEVWK